MKEDKIMKTIFACVALMAAVAPVHAQITTTTSSTTVKSSIEQPVLVTTEARHAFEVSLQTSPFVFTQTDPPYAGLQWGTLTSATNYVVLRTGQLGGPYLAIPVRDATNYRATVLPGKPYYFRVIALNSSGSPVDTTSAVSITFPMPDMTLGTGATRSVPTQCTTVVPSGYSLSWQKPYAINDVTIQLSSLTNGRWLPLSSTVQTGTSYSQTGLPAGNYRIGVHGNYTMRDYPVPGQTTSVTLLSGDLPLTLPVAVAGAC
jgi:hypothetical protein